MVYNTIQGYDTCVQCWVMIDSAGLSWVESWYTILYRVMILVCSAGSYCTVFYYPLYWVILYCTGSYCTELGHTVLYYTAHCNTLYYTAHCTVLGYTALYYTAHCNTLYYTAHCTVLGYTALYYPPCIILHTVLYCTILSTLHYTIHPASYCTILSTLPSSYLKFIHYQATLQDSRTQGMVSRTFGADSIWAIE